MRGKLIVFEGIEGCGKTTQLQRLQQWLTLDASSMASEVTSPELTSPNRRIVTTREPGGTALGQSLRQLLLTPEAADGPEIHPTAELLLYAADRAQHVMTQLKPELEAGAIVLCDRFTDSTVAYQGFGRGLDRATIDHLNQIATVGLQSNLTLWLDLDVEQSLSRTQQRGQRDRIERSSAAFHQRVREGFTALAAEYPARIVRIDASGSEEHVARSIEHVVQQHLDRWQVKLADCL